MEKGIFITFEGGEGAGKTTLMGRIAKELTGKGRLVLTTREPGGTPLGEQIRDLLLHQPSSISPYAELSLFLASRAQHVEEKIRPALREGKIVLCDRFHDSTIAYQGAARGLGMAAVEEFSRFVCQGLEPQMTLYLDIDPEIGLARAKRCRSQDRIEAEDLAFHRQIRAAFLEICKRHPSRFRVLDASQSPEEIFKQAMHFAAQLML